MALCGITSLCPHAFQGLHKEKQQRACITQELNMSFSMTLKRASKTIAPVIKQHENHIKNSFSSVLTRTGSISAILVSGMSLPQKLNPFTSPVQGSLEQVLSPVSVVLNRTDESL